MSLASTEQTSDRSPAPARSQDELLICCARVKMDPSSANRLQSLVKERIDWSSLIEMARAHGLVPLLYWNLKSVCPHDVPAEAMTRLKTLFLSTNQRNLFLAGELVKVLNLFKSHGVDAIAYKGPTISASIYGNLALRRFSDLDVLVRKSDFVRASDLLTNEGYEPELKIAPARLNAFLRVNYVQLFERPDGKAVVELHWGVAPRNFVFPFDLNSLWPRAKEIELVGQKILMPSSEDLLLLLCVHGTKDLWERLEWICGIAELVRVTPALDWERVMTEARRTFSLRMLFLGLALAHDLLGADLPDEVLLQIETDSSVPALVQLVRGLLFQADRSWGLGFKVNLHLKARERWQDRARYCARLAIDTTHGDWAVLSLPASLSFLYYLVRPFRLLKAYVRPSRH